MGMTLRKPPTDRHGCLGGDRRVINVTPARDHLLAVGLLHPWSVPLRIALGSLAILGPQ